MKKSLKIIHSLSYPSLHLSIHLYLYTMDIYYIIYITDNMQSVVVNLMLQCQILKHDLQGIYNPAGCWSVMTSLFHLTPLLLICALHPPYITALMIQR